MYYYTVTIDEEGMSAILEDLKERINAFSKRHRPFGVIVTQEQIDEKVYAQVVRFHLVLTPDFSIKNERQAFRFCQQMKQAAEEVEEMNRANYIVAAPPRRGPMGMGH